MQGPPVLTHCHISQAGPLPDLVVWALVWDGVLQVALVDVEAAPHRGQQLPNRHHPDMLADEEKTCPLRFGNGEALSMGEAFGDVGLRCHHLKAIGVPLHCKGADVAKCS